jgi:hypothetical protein
MVEFCPHCGQLGGLVLNGQSLVCSSCGQQAGVVTRFEPVVVNEADALIRHGAAACCPICQQLVELRGKTLAPHYAITTPRKLCAGSAKAPAGAVPAPKPGGKDLSAYMTRASIRVVSWRRGEVPRIEELTLAYLDKTDRVRLQIEALRDILGPNFRMREYPASLSRPQYAVWASATMCAVGKKDECGGYQPMSDAEIAQLVADLQQNPTLFLA